MQSHFVERRRHPRKLVGAFVWLALDRENAVHGRVSSDLSLDGGRFGNARSLRPGAMTLVSIVHELQVRPIECKALVC